MTVSPSTIKNVGSYKVTVKGKGNYTGTKSTTFKVNPKATTLKALTPASKAIKVSFKAQTKIMDGYYIQYSTDKNFKKNIEKVAVKKSATNYTLSKLSGSKKYYVRIATYKKVNGVIYTSSWSKALSTTTRK